MLKNSGQLKCDKNSIVFNFSKFDKEDSSTHRTNEAHCWFCLGNPEVRKELIFMIGNNNYLCCDYGPIEKFHFLLVPIDHRRNAVSLSDVTKTDILTSEKKLWEFYESEKRSVIKFERFFQLSDNISHMFINYVSFPIREWAQIMNRFEKTVLDTKMEFFELKDNEKVEDFVKMEQDGQNVPTRESFYINLEFWNSYELKKRKYLSVMSDQLSKGLPMDFMRNFICAVLGAEDKISWKECILENEEANVQIKRLRHEFQNTFA